MEWTTVLVYLAIGLVGGTFGSMVGIAGATFIVPLATLALAPDSLELRCATMVSNVAVALGAIRPYAAARSIDWRTLRQMAPAAAVAVSLGVWASVNIDAVLYRGLFGLFLVAVVARELHVLFRHKSAAGPERPLPALGAVATGAAAGLASGVLAVGGGIVMVPVLRQVAHFPIKRATGTSIATVLPSVTIGASAFVWSLSQLAPRPDGHAPVWGALAIAACLAPAALLGGWCGARLNGILPMRKVQWAVAVSLATAAGLLLHPFLAKLLHS